MVSELVRSDFDDVGNVDVNLSGHKIAEEDRINKEVRVSHQGGSVDQRALKGSQKIKFFLITPVICGSVNSLYL